MKGKEELRWTSNVVVAFSVFNNIYFGKPLHLCGCGSSKYISSEYSCEWTTQFNIRENGVCPDLTPIKEDAASTISPTAQKSKLCTIMLLSNIAEPDWVNIDCNIKYLTHILCVKKVDQNQEKSKRTKSSLNKMRSCLPAQVQVGSVCYHLKWMKDISSMSLTLQNSGTHLSPNEVCTLEIWSPMILAELPVLISLNTGVATKLQVLRCEKHGILQKCKCFFQSEFPEAFLVSKSLARRKIPGGNVFHCHNNTYTTSISRCDGKIDCPHDNSDEADCFLLGKFKNDDFGMKTNHSTCGLLLFQNQNRECTQYRLSADVKMMSVGQSIGVCEDEDYSWNDLFVDCPQEANEEQNLVDLLLHNFHHHCSKPDEIPCKQGHSKCFKISEICIFALNTFGNLFPCRNGGHMQDCSSYDCSYNFKCFESYCVSWTYVCDGKWDCPDGEEEESSLCLFVFKCDKMFKCKFTNHMCIPLRDICNNRSDCPFYDDEQLCKIDTFVCPQSCDCLSLAVSCKYFTTFVDLQFLLMVAISHSPLYFVTDSYPLFFNSVRLIFVHNQLESVCFSNLSRKLVFLNVSNNKIQCVQSCFPESLKILDLNFNNIKHLSTNNFANLFCLVFLSLSNNPLNNFPCGLFANSDSFELLTLMNMTFSQIHLSALANVDIKNIVSTDHHICCICSHSTLCKTEMPWYISCTELLPQTPVKILFITMTVLVFLLNIFTLTFHVQMSQLFQNSFLMIVVTINITDCLPSVFFAIIWVNDSALAETFLVNSRWWRSGVACFSAFCILLLFSILSQCLLCFLSLARLQIVLNPLDTKLKDDTFVQKIIATLSIASSTFALLLTFISIFVSGIVSFNLCSPFVDPSHTSVVTKVLTWFLAISQTASSVSILWMHFCLVSNLGESQKKLTKSKQDSKMALVSQLALISASNIICWFPMNCIYLVIMFLSQYPLVMVVSATGAIMPINSVLMPSTLWSFAVKRYLKEKKQTTTGNLYHQGQIQVTFNQAPTCCACQV